VIALPKSRPSSPQTVLAGFASDLLQLFTQSPSLLAVNPASGSGSASASISRASTGALDDPDAWAELSLDSPHTRPVTSTTSHAGRAAEPTATTMHAVHDVLVPVPGDDFLPDISTLERPEELTQRPPYRLIVRQEGRQRVVVESSHMGTLKVLEGYLGRWVRGNVDFVNRPPLAEIKLRESLFGLGLLYDTLVVEAGRNREVNALMVLMVVENVLGYDLVPGGGAAQGSVWEFRRARGFK